MYRETTPAPYSLPDTVGLQCHSCGSLLDPDQQCDSFDPSDPGQTQTCKVGEACLLYTYSQTPGQPDIIVRECLATDVLLGPITDPLLPSASCTIKDISEEPGSSISACLCQTDYCNVGSSTSSLQAQPARSQYTTPRSQPTTQRT